MKIFSNKDYQFYCIIKIDRNPQTINRICGRVRELGLDKIYEKCTEPKETNRQKLIYLTMIK
ncbi:MAG: hypothetical protein IKJ31_03695 [Bacteroidaceae bacterium]|nr:hypothetical protein [Bacteroidaceae bacterium]